MPYIDTSIIVKLYVRENHSLEVIKWISENNEAIALTSLHELEFTNAIQFKLFRKEILPDQASLILSRFKAHQEGGVYHRPRLIWSDVWDRAVDLSQNLTANTGSRSLDILHVTSALLLKLDRFATLDNKQSELASKAGLKVIKII